MEDKTFEMIEKLYNRMEEGFSRIDERFSRVDERFEQIDGRFTGIESELRLVSQSVVRIEHDHGQKLDALFDGYKANTEAIQELRTDVKELKKEVETHEVKLKIVK